MAFHENLRTLRLARNLTQPALAEKADIEQSYLSKLENGRSKPSPEVLSRIAAALETEVETLANGDEPGSGRRKIMFAAITLAGFLLLALMFILGRITSIYSINPHQVVAGSRSQLDLTQQIMNLAPDGVVVDHIYYRMGVGWYEVTGTAPTRASVNGYLNIVRKKFGGEFEIVGMDKDQDNHSIKFIFDYAPHGIGTEPKAASADR